MRLALWLIALSALISLVLALRRAAKRRRRRQLLSEHFPGPWERILRNEVAFYRQLEPALQEALRRRLRFFLAEKRFEGCAGLVVTEAMRVIIAAHACRLVLRLGEEPYPGLYSVLVYPTGYSSPVHEPVGGTTIVSQEDRLGESWHFGTVVLAWDEIQKSALEPDTAGRNLVLHEFAHQLDVQEGEADGVPSLGQPRRYGPWARVLSQAYHDLRRRVESGRPAPLDPYAAEHPAEFFAVATEYFFERPRALARAYPKVYEQLKGFYRQDPLGAEDGTKERALL